MYHVFKTSGSGHEHRIDVRFLEEARRAGNDWQDVDLVGLSSLANVACPNKPRYVLLSIRPPKSIQDAGACRINALVAESVVSFDEDGGSAFWGED